MTGSRIIYEMDCKSDPKEVRKIEAVIKKLSRENHLTKEQCYKLLIVCTEAVNNAIIHGNKLDGNKNVNVKCCVTAHKVTMTVKDKGAGFEMEKLPNPIEEKNLLKESGRGVFLIRSLMDDVKFKKLKNGSTMRMSLNR
ncbi:MAG: ATP-binding protein [Bacteroidota bacterium]